uniref:Ammonium transporter AmtB-like domain-containing protein n=1 Tax=Clytia hemisphaerica TaxID=252671 RepID=A0A7M5WQ78_9CNID
MDLSNCSIGHTNLTWEAIQKLFESSRNNDAAGDATWILTSAFIIFTMQSGFGLLEAGTVSSKNETNIMVKNAVDVIFGALGYWVCGFAFSFGDDPDHSNGFTGFGHFFTDEDEHDREGKLFAKYFFQLSFATTATTIVSGAMAERANLKAYMFFSFVNFLSYVFPAHWIWAEQGYFLQLGVVDVAGCGPVHLVGGVSALIASIMLKPRLGVFVDGKKNTPPMGCPTNVLLGTFMLWWGWLGFNCGSTFGVSGGMQLMDWLEIDDPVSAVPVHGLCGAWGMVVVGLAGEKDDLEGISRYPGVFKGGPFIYLGYQCLAVLAITVWAAGTAFLELLLANFIFGLRMTPEEELIGADFTEHGILTNPELPQITLDQYKSQYSTTKYKHHRKTSRTIEELFEEPDGSKIFTVDRQIYSKYTSSPNLAQNITRQESLSSLAPEKYTYTNYGYDSSEKKPKTQQPYKTEFSIGKKLNNLNRIDLGESSKLKTFDTKNEMKPNINKQEYVDPEIYEWSQGKKKPTKPKKPKKKGSNLSISSFSNIPAYTKR